MKVNILTKDRILPSSLLAFCVSETLLESMEYEHELRVSTANKKTYSQLFFLSL